MSKNIRNEIICNSSSSGSNITPYYYDEFNILVYNCGTDITPMAVSFERIGNTVTFTHERIYNDQQVAATMFTQPIPEKYRPRSERLLLAYIIDGASDYGVNHLGLTYTPTATRALGIGACKIYPSGMIEWGKEPYNDETMEPFSSNAISGSSNGLISAVHTYSI